MKLSYDDMVAAMRRNDSKYDGCFYVGVHSTGIYCLPSCKARAPKLENVVFYATREEAIAAGLRGCLRCRAECYPDVLPKWLKSTLKHMQETLDCKLDEYNLIRLSGVDISTMRRYFHQHFGITPLAFHRKLRLKRAHQMITEGANYLTAAYECGYQSASGFRQAFIRLFGYTPGSLHNGK